MAPHEDLFRDPLHQYTQALISAIPIPDPKLERERILLEGEVPSPRNPPAGCPFVTRCQMAEDRCKTDRPPLVQIGERHEAACWLVEQPAAAVSR